MTQTQHLQKVLLIIIKDVDELCKRHNIPYFLFGGSALGAVRHGGFIPWDDDLDIALYSDDYDKFISMAKNELDPNKYYLQEGLIDWTEDYTKIKLKGTHINEYGEYYTGPESDGIFIDIFRLDKASNYKLGRMFQYIYGKILLIQQMRGKGYTANSLYKKILMKFSVFFDNKWLSKIIKRQYYKYNCSDTKWISRVLGQTRMKNAFLPKTIFGTPIYMTFEDTMLPVPENVDKYLTITYGNYLQLPPEEKRVGVHITNIDFGNY